VEIETSSLVDRSTAASASVWMAIYPGMGRGQVTSTI